MVERWGSTGSTLLTVLTNVFYIVPYFLFFLGLGFRYASYTDELLSTARFVQRFSMNIDRMKKILESFGHLIWNYGISGR